ncbi:hypothetical protein FJTKL_02142 [Diaporthe vaccinii]|uniref:Uncharacterized protein n=1 Tax=Diaporthe vaccinii TaxID=105482 RepID=A0ABR4DYQ1_9PEZI
METGAGLEWSSGLQCSRVVMLLECSRWRPRTRWSLDSYSETEYLADKRERGGLMGVVVEKRVWARSKSLGFTGTSGPRCAQRDQVGREPGAMQGGYREPLDVRVEVIIAGTGC